MALKRELTKFDLLFLAVGSIIGSGWLFGSLYTAQIAGPAAIFSWIIGGFFIAIIALTIAEISTLIPITGGSTSYAALSHGHLCGAIFAWITWLWTMTIPAVEVQAVVQYASTYIPSLYYPKTNSLTATGFMFVTVTMFCLCFLNLIGIKLIAKTNKFIVFWKLVIPFVVAIVLMTYKTHPTNLTSSGGFTPYGIGGIFSGISNGGIALSFFGFQIGIFVAGETKNPQKTIPFSLFGSLFICTILYVCLQYGFIVSLEPSAISGGWSNINYTGDAGPFAGILMSLGLIFLVNILYFDAILSPMGTAITHTVASSRILYSLSLQGEAPKFLSKLNRYSSPWTALLANFVFGMLFFLPFSGWQSMVSFLSAAIILTLSCGPICLPIYRKKFPNFSRPFLLPFGTTISFIAFYFCNLILHWTGWDTIYKLDITLAAGLVVFFVLKLFSSAKNKFANLDFKSSLWLFSYLFLISVLSYFSEFGHGKGLIKQNYDFVLVFAVTVIIFIFAQKTAIKDAKTQEIYDDLLQKTHEKNATTPLDAAV